jgi:hypothetical protein
VVSRQQHAILANRVCQMNGIVPAQHADIRRVLHVLSFPTQERDQPCVGGIVVAETSGLSGAGIATG